jgi:putative solute:sodium symporter small subunit
MTEVGQKWATPEGGDYRHLAAGSHAFSPHEGDRQALAGARRLRAEIARLAGGGSTRVHRYCFPAMHEDGAYRAYWRRNLRYLGILLAIWFAVSYGCGILFVDELNRVRLGGFKLGFWFAQQGSIYVFVILIFVYVFLMNRLDRRYSESMKQGGDSGDAAAGGEHRSAAGTSPGGSHDARSR